MRQQRKIRIFSPTDLFLIKKFFAIQKKVFRLISLKFDQRNFNKIPKLRSQFLP